MSDLHQFVQQTKAQRKGTVRPLPEFEPYQNFVYDASQLRDPFVAKTDVLFDDQDQPVSANGISPNRSRRREPLESYPLDTLKMVGVLEQNEVTWGLIQAPDETIHRVLAGNYAGQNYGEITSISEEKISVYEIIPDGQDGWTEREAALVLGDE
jgi:type IV pilus assembly protein PilP